MKVTINRACTQEGLNICCKMTNTLTPKMANSNEKYWLYNNKENDNW